MRTKALMIAGLLSLPLSAPVYSQNQAQGQAQNQAQTPPPPKCQTDPGFKDFDFWVGHWSVSARSNGQHAGTNKITRMEGNCMLREEWTSAQGGTGQSMNYYNPVTGKWRQLWVSAGAGGYVIDYEGSLRDGSMVMEGSISYYQQNQAFPFRGTWTPNEDGSVRQFFEQFNPDTKEWQPWFDGLYVHIQKGE